MQVMQPLTDGERLRFEHCRETIRANLKTCFEVGSALAEIRDSKLYREHWNNFQDFCKAEFNIGKSHAYRLIGASGVRQSLQPPPTEPASDADAAAETSPNGGQNLSERCARELKNVPVELRKEVLEAAAAACGGEPTAEAIREAAKTIVPQKPTEPSKPIIELDSTGFAIPEKLVGFWNRSGEVRKLLTAVSTIRVALRKAQEEDDPLYRPVVGKGHEQTWTGLITNLDKAYVAIGLAVPYAVCPTCQGRLLKQCGTCQERGFVSEFYYKHAFASDARRVREAACQKKDK